MRYRNPVIRGFYPDPSICEANGKFYLVCSSFQYFPGVPLFESDDLVNYRQIGYVLTRKSQVMLEGINSSGGVFAPTIRYNDGRFYMVTTNDTTHENFYVYTDDIHGEWSDPVKVDQGGIDPSLLFDGDRVYFISNGTDAHGVSGIVQCEIDIATGRKLTESRTIWSGSGGRYLESPHMYKIGGSYYLMAAEGGTEYGHMVTYARSDDPWGPFTGYEHNPVLTNRNKAPFIIQGIGHGDLIQDKYGDWYILTLGFRQTGIWEPYHNLGREVFLTPVSFGEDGNFTAGRDGTTDEEYETRGGGEQVIRRTYSFDDTDPAVEWCRLRHPHEEDYIFAKHAGITSWTLCGTDVTLDDTASPTFIAMRQRDFRFELRVHINLSGSGLGGVTMYMCENEHYDVYVLHDGTGDFAVLKLNIGGIKHEQARIPIPHPEAELIVRGNEHTYDFSFAAGGREAYLGSGITRYLSSEVSGGFTGVMTGLFAVGAKAEFTYFEVKYE